MNSTEKYKIAVVGNFGMSNTGPTDDSKGAEAFQELGHTVTTVTHSEVLDHLDDFVGQDLVIMYNYPYMLGTINQIKAKAGCPVYYWTNDLMRGRTEKWYPTSLTGLEEDKGFADMASEATVVLGLDIHGIPYWAAKGVNFHYFPCLANSPKYFHPIPNTEKIYDVVFAGSAYPHGRRDCLMLEVAEEYDLHVWSGNVGAWVNNLKMNPEKIHQAVFDEELSKVYAQSKIVLGISWNTIYPGCWSDRTVKTTLCGAFHLTKYIPLMEREYQDGIAYFKTFEECREKIGYYLEHEEEREAIAKRGLEIALERHTLQVRLKQLLAFFKYQESPIMLDRKPV